MTAMGATVALLAALLAGGGFGYLLALADERRRWHAALEELADNDFQAGYESGHEAGRKMMLETATAAVTDNRKFQRGRGLN